MKHWSFALRGRFLGAVLCLSVAARAAEHYFLDFNEAWPVQINLALSDAAAVDGGTVSAFTPDELNHLETNILARLQELFAGYEMTFSRSDPGGTRTRLDFGYPVPGGQALGSTTQLDFGNFQSGAEIKMIIPNWRPTIYNYLNGTRAELLAQLSQAMANIGGHEIGHTLGLNHHHTYGDPGITPANYAETAGLQTRHLMVSAPSGGGPVQQALPHSLNRWERAYLDIAGGTLAGGNTVVRQPIQEDDEVTDAGSDSSTAQALRFRTGQTSALRLSLQRGRLHESASDVDVYSFTTTSAGLFTVELASRSTAANPNRDDPPALWFEGQLRLLAMDGTTVLASNQVIRFDENEFNTGPARAPGSILLNIPLTQVGTYFIEVSPVSDANTGDFYELLSGFDGGIATATVPSLIHYQGRVSVGMVAFNGTGRFKFALVDAAGEVGYWTNDGTQGVALEPQTAVTLPVTLGLYSVLLGDPSLAAMTPVAARVFEHPDVHLRVWFDDGLRGFQRITPDQRILSVGYAQMAATLPGGALISGETPLPILALEATRNDPSALSFRTDFRTWWVGQNRPPEGSVSPGSFFIYDQSAHATRLIIDTNGLVGIGTAQPSSKLDVSGTVAATGYSGSGAGLINPTVMSGPATNVIPVLGMVWLAPGSFTLGSPTTEPGHEADEGPQTQVTLTRSFWIGAHEVTQREFVGVLAGNPSLFLGDPNRPVEQVSWLDATAYCNTLTDREIGAGRIAEGWRYRLPTEAEWEYACRAGARTTRFSYGTDPGATALSDYAWYIINSGNQTHPVEQALGNPWGLMDLHGNVREWCQDPYGAYPGGSVVDPTGPASGGTRVIRGGAYSDPAVGCRSANRDSGSQTHSSPGLGFRIVLAFQPPPP